SSLPWPPPFSATRLTSPSSSGRIRTTSVPRNGTRSNSRSRFPLRRVDAERRLAQSSVGPPIANHSKEVAGERQRLRGAQARPPGTRGGPIVNCRLPLSPHKRHLVRLGPGRTWPGLVAGGARRHALSTHRSHRDRPAHV